MSRFTTISHDAFRKHLLRKQYVVVVVVEQRGQGGISGSTAATTPAAESVDYEVISVAVLQAGG